MQSTLVKFIHVLRSHDIRVSPAESLDAMQIASTLGYKNRTALQSGLGMALAKTTDEKAVFVQCFDKFFSMEDFAKESATTDSETEQEENNSSGEQSFESAANESNLQDQNSSDSSASLSALEEAAQEVPSLQAAMNGDLLQNLMNNNSTDLSIAIAQAGEQVGLSGIQLFTQKGQFSRRMLDAMGEEQLRQAVIDLERVQSPALAELQRYRDLLRDQVRDFIDREYLLQAEGKTQQFMDDLLAKAKLNAVEQRYQDRVHQLVRKMAKKLAAKHSRKRKVARRGQLNMRKTIKQSIATDGVIFKPHWKQIHRDKPQIMAICDVSGSVAAYAKFLLMFLYSLQDVLPKVRSFAFSSHLGEVSHIFANKSIEKAVEMVNWQYGGATDYGSSLADFEQLAMADIGSTTTVIILGDARNNNGEPRVDILQKIYQRARTVIWLNPESRNAWGTGDSEMPRYRSACHTTAQCNNLKQLERVIDQLLRHTQ